MNRHVRKCLRWLLSYVLIAAILTGLLLAVAFAFTMRELSAFRMF